MSADLFETTKIKLDQGKRDGARLLRCIWHNNRASIGSARRVRTYLTVGRGGEDIEFVFPDDPTVSRRHATLTATLQGELFIEDHATANGTFVDGKAIVGKQPLADNTIVRMGETLFEFVLGSPMTVADQPDDIMIGISPAFLRMASEADQAAPTSMSVLLIGESGTGKGRLSQRIHARSQRRGPLVVLHCSNDAEIKQIDANVLARADGGTLMLEDVDECSDDEQLGFLQALSAAPHAVRIISSATRDVAQLVAAGRFRRDLYARLAGYVILLPPLSERRADVPILLERFVMERNGGKPLGLSGETMERIVLTPWDMNLHGLRILADRLANVPDHSFVDPEVLLRGLVLRLQDVGRSAHQGLSALSTLSTLSTLSKEALEAALSQYHGKVSLVAAHFGKDRKQIYRWFERYGIDPVSFR